MLIYKIRRLKPIVMLGTCLFLISFGLLIRYRGGATEPDHAGVIAAQVVLGIGGGLFPYPTLASIQAATKHEHVAAITSLYFAAYNFGAALGNAVSGAIWTQILPGILEEHLGNAEVAREWYISPFDKIPHYPVGTPERAAVIEAFKHIQRVLCITGAGLCVALVFFSCVIRNPRLPDTQSMEDAEAGGVEMSNMNKTNGVTEGNTRKSRTFWKK